VKKRTGRRERDEESAAVAEQIKVEQPGYAAVVGLDVGDKESRYCVLDAAGDVVGTGTVRTNESRLRLFFQYEARLRIAMEVGTHSPWASRLLEELGHEVIVANPRNLRLISESDSKNDRADAWKLAKLAQVGPELLSPIRHRSQKSQHDLALIRARECAVQARTKLVNAMRGIVKSSGYRLPSCSTGVFAGKVKEQCPESLKMALLPLARMVDGLTKEIRLYDRMVRTKARQEYPETKVIQTIYGVGPVTALSFVLILDNDKTRFRKSRDVGCYVGLRPKQQDSGSISRQLGISKAGDRLLRKLAVQCAQHVLGPFGKDSALRRWGLMLAVRGGKNAKKRAIVAVARKLVILMHRVWVSQQPYEPMRGIQPTPAAN